jgi:two-component system cell cycle sensor histidine kinase/response regulator CckA
MATILIVDDAASREPLVALLLSAGYELLEAANGADALDAVRSQHPDLVITAVLMPVMDGFEFVRQLRLNPATTAIPVVFYTAHYGAHEARALALSSGVSRVLTKPAEPGEMLEVVKGVLSRGPENGEAGDPLSTALRQEHLRLVTNKLHENTDDLTAANTRLRALINIGLEIASERDSERLLRSVCVAAHRLFNASYVTLGILDQSSRAVSTCMTWGATTAEWLKPGDPLSGFLQTVVLERRTMRGHNPGGVPARLDLPPAHPEVWAFLAAPIASPANVYGWICLVGNEERHFSDEDEDLIRALSGQVGRIYENVYFYALAQKRAEELEVEVAERQRAESAVRRERDRAHQYLETAEVILLALDTEGRITLVNRHACSILGWTADELQGRDWIETCLPARVRTTVRENFQTLIEGGEFSHAEGPVLTRAGEELLVEWRNRVLLDGAGEVVGTLSSGSDITERVRAAEEIRERAQLSALGAAVGLSLTDTESLQRSLQECAESLVTHLGAAAARIWTLDEAQGVAEPQATAGLGSPASREFPLKESVLQGIVRDRRPVLARVTADGGVIDPGWARREGVAAVAGYPLIVEGRVIGVMAVFTRQTLSPAVISTLGSLADHIALGIERHCGVRALRIAEERMRFALEAAGVGIWDMDYTTRVVRWSETLEAHYGLPPGGFGGTFEESYERIHPADRQSVREATRCAVESGTDFTTLHRSVWPDGTIRWLSGAGRIHLGKAGQPVRAIGIALDVTQRRTLEDQYQQAQKMEAVGQLAAGVAHDFNNLLTAILGYCELLLNDLPPDDPSTPDITEIQMAGERAAGLTRQLLAFSRKEIIQPTLLDLNALIANVQSMLGRLIGDDVTIVLDLARGLANVTADRGQVEQIVLNLAVNARDAMPAGGTLTITTANVELDEPYASVKPGPYVLLAVTDTGTGISPEVRTRLFEPFFTTKEPGKGTGLGLATVLGIVTRSGGSIQVDSEVGKGTSFKVHFPAAEAGDPGLAARPPAAPRHEGSCTVLVVEEAEGLRELARRLLERQGYTVLLARDAEEAAQAVDRDAAIDVLLTDIVMPGASGPEVTRRLVARRPGLKVIYMSGYTEDAIAHEGELLPGIVYLHKPFTSETLDAKIREVLDR